MGQEIRTTNSVPRDFKLSIDSVQRVQLYPHEEWDEPPYPCARIRVASCLQSFPNPARNVHGGVDWFLGNATMIYPAPPSCQLNGQTSHDQLLGLPPHMWYVVCTGGCSDTLSQWTVLNPPWATSLEIPHSQWPTPCLSEKINLTTKTSYQIEVCP